MKRYLILFFLLVPSLCFPQSISWTPFKLLPFGLRLSPSGIAITVAQTLATKFLGKFSASLGYDIFKFSDTSKPYYSSNFGSTSGNYNSSSKIIIENKDFLLIIRYNKDDYVYSIPEYEEIEILTDGKTKISSGVGRLVIDVSNAKLDAITFRGRKYINKTGLTELKKELKYDPTKINYIGEYNADGNAEATYNYKRGVIDRSLNIITPFIYDDIKLKAKNESDNLIVAKYGDKWGFIDYESNIIIPFHYSDASNFDPITHLAKVRFSGKSFLINKQGVISDKYEYDFYDCNSCYYKKITLTSKECFLDENINLKFCLDEVDSDGRGVDISFPYNYQKKRKMVENILNSNHRTWMPKYKEWGSFQTLSSQIGRFKLFLLDTYPYGSDLGKATFIIKEVRTKDEQ